MNYYQRCHRYVNINLFLFIGFTLMVCPSSLDGLHKIKLVTSM